MLATKHSVLRRFWYPVMPVSALGDKPVPFTLLGEKIVIWKMKSGELACLKDRCCHRTRQVSLGFIEDDQTVCGYHGWTFEAGGACVRVPQQADCPRSRRRASRPIAR